MDFKYDPCDTTTNADTCILTINHDTLARMMSSDIPIDIVANDHVQWIFEPGTAPLFHCMQMTWELDSALTVGHVLNYNATYYCGGRTSDGNNSNNTKTTIVSVASGPAKTTSGGVYDLNSMISSDQSKILPYEIDDDIPFISYEILFTNTTSDTAFCMTIENEIPDELEITSITHPFSSMPFEVYIHDKTMYVNYESIVFPDTGTSEMRSYGFLQYNIQLKDGILPGTVIDNEAKIYFNNYDPISTNVVSHKVVEETGIEDNDEPLSFVIAPNPNNGTFTIVFSKDNSENRCDLTIFDLVGTEVYQALDLQTNVINVNELAQGVYLVKLNVGGIISTRKMVVE